MITATGIIALVAALIQLCVALYVLRLGRLMGARALSWLLFAAVGLGFVLRLTLAFAPINQGALSFWPGIREEGFALLGSALLLVAMIYIERSFKSRQKAEQALVESERRFTSFANNTPGAAWMNDKDGRYVYINKPFEKIFHKSESEVLGKNALELLPESDARLLNEHDEQVLKTGAAMQTYEFLTTPDGVRREWWVFKFPFTDERGQRYVGGMGFDVTEQRHGARALRDSERLFRSVWDGSGDAMRLTDHQGRIVAVNGAFCRLVNLSVAQLVGQSLVITYPPEDHEAALQRHTRRFESRISDEVYERRIILLSGQSIEVEVSNSLIERENDPPLLLSIFRDITERCRDEEQRLVRERNLLEGQKSESLGVLAGGVAHDFNNLLTAIMGNVGLAMMETPQSSPTQAYLRNIERVSVRAAELCRQMLAYSGRGKFAVQRMELNSIVEEMRPLLEASVGKQIVLGFEFADDLPSVEVDTAQIRQVILNLVTNASEAIGDNAGVITISTGLTRSEKVSANETSPKADLPKGDCVSLEVSDTGCGMTPQTKARIFEPFFTTKFTGRGLGLAAVLGIVRGHKGSLNVQSEPGRGSTFRLLLPCVQAANGDRPSEARRSAAWVGHGTVLVVDDEDTVRHVAGRILEKFGFKVLSAGDGQEGVEVFRQHADELALVVLDMAMPRMNGDEAFREIRRIRPGARVVLMSGYSEAVATERFVGKGLAGFLQKPFRPEDLREKVRSVLERKP